METYLGYFLTGVAVGFVICMIIVCLFKDSG